MRSEVGIAAMACLILDELERRSDGVRAETLRAALHARLPDRSWDAHSSVAFNAAVVMLLERALIERHPSPEGFDADLLRRPGSDLPLTDPAEYFGSVTERHHISYATDPTRAPAVRAHPSHPHSREP